eukprot:778422_1
MSSVGSYATYGGSDSYCCGAHTPFPQTNDEAKLIGFEMFLMKSVKHMVGEFLGVPSAGYEGVRLSAGVGYCAAEPTKIEAVMDGAEEVSPRMTCVPLCCACCHDMTIRDDMGTGLFYDNDAKDSDDTGHDAKDSDDGRLALTGRDLHLCCPKRHPNGGFNPYAYKCFVQDGQTGKVVVGNDAHFGPLDILQEAIHEFTAKCINADPFDQLACTTAKNALATAHDTAVIDIGLIVNDVEDPIECAALVALSPFDFIDLVCDVGVSGQCKDKLEAYQTLVDAVRGCFVPNPVTVYCEARSDCN